MRQNSLLRQIVGVESTRVSGFYADDGVLVVRVRPTWMLPRCSRCSRIYRGAAPVATEGRRWRHLDVGGIEVHLEYDVRWVPCPDCGRTVECVPWASEARARFTEDFDDQVACLLQRCDRSTVERLLRISWRSVGRAVERVLRRRQPAGPLDGLTTIGVDELSYRKGHQYVTLVVDLAHRRVVWGREGKSSDTLKAFFQELGPERRQRIKIVCIDMSKSYQKAVREAVPHAELVFDRFHVQALASKALDETRRLERVRLRGVDTRTRRRLRWALLKDDLTLSEAEQAALACLQQENARVYRAYLLKEQLGDILDRRQVNVVQRLLEKWCSWAARSRLSEFVKLAKTIRGHMQGILGYVRYRVTNGPTEGLNNKARLVQRRAYGFHSAEAVIAAIMLCCSGLDLPPVHKTLAA